MSKPGEIYFIASEKTIEECKEKLKKKPLMFEDVKTMYHGDYLEEIKKEKAVLICSSKPVSVFPDNLQGECDECGCAIYYRPYNQDAAKKVCERCIVRIIESEKNKQKQ